MLDNMSDAEFELFAAQMARIYGDVTSGQGWFLPFTTVSDTMAFLETVQDNSGDAGIRVALERHLGSSLPDGTSGAITPGD
jgi:hypothetical protein